MREAARKGVVNSTPLRGLLLVELDRIEDKLIV